MRDDSKSTYQVEKMINRIITYYKILRLRKLFNKDVTFNIPKKLPKYLRVCYKGEEIFIFSARSYTILAIEEEINQHIDSWRNEKLIEISESKGKLYR